MSLSTKTGQNESIYHSCKKDVGLVPSIGLIKSATLKNGSQKLTVEKLTFSVRADAFISQIKPRL